MTRQTARQRTWWLLREVLRFEARDVTAPDLLKRLP